MSGHGRCYECYYANLNDHTSTAFGDLRHSTAQSEAGSGRSVGIVDKVLTGFGVS